MGYFISILRERIANFEAPPAPRGEADAAAEAQRRCAGISINDLRKNLRDLNEHMDRECASAAARYGIDARRLADHRHRSAARGRVGAGGDQHRAQPGLLARSAWPRPRPTRRSSSRKRAVEIETLKAQAEVEPLLALADQLARAQGERRPGGARRLPAQRAARPATPRPSRCFLEVRSMIGRSSSRRRHRLLRLPDRRAGLPRRCCGCFGLYTIVDERRCHVYVLFGKVVGVLDEPGLHFLPLRARASRRSSCTGSASATWSTCASTRSTCAASRSTPRRARRWASASGTRCSSRDPVAYLFKNTDPRGSLRANVSNATVRCLSQHAARATCSRTATR